MGKWKVSTLYNISKQIFAVFIIKSILYFESTDSNFVLDTAEGWQALGLPSTDDLTSHRNISRKKYEHIYIFTVGVVVSEQIMSVPYQYNRKSQ